MPRSFLRSAFRRLPSVARRDARIDRLRRRVARLLEQKEQLEQLLGRVHDESATRPSYRARIHADRRVGDRLADLGRPPTRVGPLGKLTDNEFARSHGIAVPQELFRWDSPRDISWRDLPDLVVVKSAFGASARGVLPLRRVGVGWQVVTRDEVVTAEQLVERLESWAARRKVSGPYFAEEYLDDGSGSPPTDVRVLVFYGEVGHVALRQPDWHGHDASARYRYVLADGSTCLETHPELTIDPDIPIPPSLDALVETASRLSVALREPFVRIDLYDVGGRVVFGEVTRRPGGTQWHGHERDLELGRAWERAQARLDRDIADGMSPEPEWGPHGEASVQRLAAL